MKVLFVCSGNKGIFPNIQSQANPLKKQRSRIRNLSNNRSGFTGISKKYSKIKKEHFNI